MSAPSVSFLVPTWNGGREALDLVAALRRQVGVQVEIVVADSGSRDGTTDGLRRGADRFLDVAAGTFDHGGTRNLLARSCRGDILVFLTQDVAVRDPMMTRKLVEPLVTGDAAASFARQLPRDRAGPLEVFNREWSYPATSWVRDLSATATHGLRAFSFSNAAGAVTRPAFEAVGGFPAPCASNEDMLLAARILRAGLRVAYVAEAAVVHSHGHSLVELFRRFRLMGRGLGAQRPELMGVGAWGSGGGLLRAQLRHGFRHRLPGFIVAAILEAGAKGGGFFVGANLDRK